MMAFLFMFAICFVQNVAAHLNDLHKQGIDVDDHELISHYGSVGTAMYTLFSASTGGDDWRNAANPLEDVGAVNNVIFVVYMVMFTFVLTNSVTAIFVESASEYAGRDKDRVIQDQLAKKQEYMSDIYVIYNEIDGDGSGEVTYEEFKEHLADPAMISFAQSLEIDIMDLEAFFLILSARGSKSVDLETFVEGCIKLRGQARSMDVMDLMIKTKEIAADLIMVKEQVIGRVDPSDHPELLARVSALAPELDPLADKLVIPNSLGA